MARNNTIKLLLVNDSDNETERLVSLFRRAGRVARAHRVAAVSELTAALEEPWDLLIADERASIAAGELLRAVAAAGGTVPTLIIGTGEPQPLFAAGARDLVAPDDEQRLVCAALRELEFRMLRLRLDEVQHALTEAEQRNALLLGESASAIAYVTDGMISGASPLFAERFGYADGDAVDCLPFIDLIAPASHNTVKTGLKKQDGIAVPFEGITAQGAIFQALLQSTASTYDGEPCIQVTVSEEAVGAGSSCATPDRDAGGLFTEHWFRGQLAELAGSTALAVRIDNFVLLRRQLGYSASQALAVAVAHFVGAQEEVAPQPVVRLADDGLAVALPLESQPALTVAQRLSQIVGDHIFDIDGQSLQCTVSIGLAPVGAAGANATLDRAVAACDQLREARANAGIGNGAHLYQTSEETRRGQTLSPEAALQEALDESRFQLLFQPIISLRGSRGDHYETLLRLRGDTDDLELPDNLLSGLAVDPANAKLDRWVLIEATKRLAENRAQGNDTRLVINLQASALIDDGLAAWLGVALRAADLPAEALVLQLREADVITYLKPARQFADAVRQLGCRLSIAGFGRALDPLKTLKTVATDLVQLDGNFTRELQTGGDVQSLKELVSATSTQGVKVIIPFVENASVLATLWQVGADFIQGHYLQPPHRDMNYEFADIA